MPSEIERTPSSQGSLTTDPDRFSNDSWNLLLSAQDVARRWRHRDLDVEHILQVLFSDRAYNRFINKLPINSSELLDQVEDFLAEQPISSDEELFIGDELENLLENAEHFRNRWGSRLIEVSHLLIALGRDRRIGAELFEELGLPSEQLEAALKKAPSTKVKARNSENTSQSQLSSRSIPIKNDNIKSLSNHDSTTDFIDPQTTKRTLDLEVQQEPKALEAYGRDLTSAAKEGRLDPVIGRDPEIRNLIKVLSRRSKNNPVLIGAPGVGKTAIAELLAQRIISGEVPESLKGLKLISLDVGALVAGAKFRGQFEERFRSVMAEVSSPDSRVVLFIDELHTIVSPERSSADAANLLKPVLARGDLRCIGATTPENYRRTVEKDPALNRRFQQVLIKEPSLDLSVEILRGVKERYELHHGVTITDEAIQTANRLADRYISDRCLPDKAIDLIDEAAAQLKMEVTSKPQIIEEAESELQHLELALIANTSNSHEKQKELKEKRSLSAQNLSDLQERWTTERSQSEELRRLLQQDEDIRNAISEAERDGDLEEAARLQYDKLHFLQQRKAEIEESLAAAQASGKAILRDHVEPEDIADVVSRWTGIPVNRVLAEERQKLLTLEDNLEKKVIGQLEAVQAVAAAIRRARAGMKDPRRPVGSFLFLGPTGVGKTELAKTLAASLFDEEEALVRLDMSEFMERNAVARLLGAPPGYVGYEEGGQLTEAVRRRPYAVLLLDEIEKAHPDVFNVLLQVLDDGRLTDSQGRTVDFRHTVIVMTSNLASREILDTSRLSKEQNNDLDDLNQALSTKIDDALAQQFRPEFLNRIDEIIRFRPLKKEDLQKIVRLQLNVLANLLTEQGIKLIVEGTVIEALAFEGYEPEYGARPLRRVIRRKLENPLATQLLEQHFHNARTVRVKPAENASASLIFVAED